MNNHRQRADMPRIDNASDKPPSNMAPRQSQLSGPNREQLIRQFQSIDGSTRTDAEQQIDAYERSFLSIFESPPINSATQGNAKEAIKRPPYPNAASP